MVYNTSGFNSKIYSPYMTSDNKIQSKKNYKIRVWYKKELYSRRCNQHITDHFEDDLPSRSLDWCKSDLSHQSLGCY